MSSRRTGTGSSGSGPNKQSRYPTRNVSTSDKDKDKSSVVVPQGQGQDNQSNSAASEQNICLTFDASKKMPGPDATQYEWGKYHACLIETLNHNIGIVNNSLTTLKTVSGTANSALTIASDNQKRINKVETDLIHLKKDNLKLLNDNASLKERTIKLEYSNNKNYLLFCGIPESEEESCTQSVINTLSNITDLDVSESSIVKCFRLGKNEPDKTRTVKCIFSSSHIAGKILKLSQK